MRGTCGNRTHVDQVQVKRQNHCTKQVPSESEINEEQAETSIDDDLSSIVSQHVRYDWTRLQDANLDDMAHWNMNEGTDEASVQGSDGLDTDTREVGAKDETSKWSLTETNNVYY